MARYLVCAADEVPPGAAKVVEVAGRSIGVFNIGGEYYALRNRCPHQGGPLCLGQVSGFLMARVPGEYTYVRRGEIVRCPWHGWEFDIKTGQSWFDPQRMRVRSYPVAVETVTSNEQAAINGAEDGLQKGPYTAESYPVTVEQRLIFVEIG